MPFTDLSDWDNTDVTPLGASRFQPMLENQRNHEGRIAPLEVAPLALASGSDPADKDQWIRTDLKEIRFRTGGKIYSTALAEVPAPITTYTYNFTDVNGTAWPTPWTKHGTNGVMDIQGERGRLTTPATQFSRCFGRWNGTEGNVEVSGIVVAPDTVNNNRCEIMVRADFTNNNWYCLRPYFNFDVWNIARYDANTRTLLTADVAFAFADGVAARFRFRAEGTTLYAKMWADGSAEPTAWGVQVTDSTYTSGDVGLNHETGVAASKIVEFDDIVIESLPTTASNILFEDAFELTLTGGAEFVPPWTSYSQANTDRITTSIDVARAGTRSLKLICNNDDDDTPLTGNTATYSANPRAQIQKDELFGEGDDTYMGFSLYLPTTFPAIPTGGWLMLSEIGFPRDFGDTNAIRVVLEAGDKIYLVFKTANTSLENLWSATYTKGVWMDLVLRVKWSQDPAIGFIEFWFNDTKVTFPDGTKRVYRETLDALRAAGAKGNFHCKNYRGKDQILGDVILYEDAVKIGSSYSTVAPSGIAEPV